MVGRIIGVTIKSIALVMGFTLGLALTFSGLFFIGIPVIIACVWLFVRLVKKERLKTYGTKGVQRTITKAEKEAGDQTYSEERSTGNSVAHGNPVADAAISYAIGKTLSDKLQADYKQSKKHFFFGDGCATCEYWIGERTAKKQNYYKGAECPDRNTSGKCGCKGGQYYGRIMLCGSGRCRNFERWKNC